MLDFIFEIHVGRLVIIVGRVVGHRDLWRCRCLWHWKIRLCLEEGGHLGHLRWEDNCWQIGGSRLNPLRRQVDPVVGVHLVKSLKLFVAALVHLFDEYFCWNYGTILIFSLILWNEWKME